MNTLYFQTPETMSLPEAPLWHPCFHQTQNTRGRKHWYLMRFSTAKHGGPGADDSGDTEDDGTIIVTIIMGTNFHRGLTMSQELCQVL